MLDPYRMIIVNLAASAAVIGGLLLYRYFFPKKKINLFLLLILISVLPILSLLRAGDYESGDFNIHVYRAMSFYTALSEGIVMPSWASGLNAKYGYPLFVFLNPLPYYTIALFYFLGFSFIASAKIFLGLTYVLSGVFMYLWIKELFKNDLSAFAGSIFYLFAPYHLVDLHFRATVGEMAIFMFLPLLFYFVTVLIKKPNLTLIVATGVAIACTILSHQAMGMYTLFFLIPYVLFLWIKEKKIRISAVFGLILSAVIGFAISGYTILPYLLHANYTNASVAPLQLSFPTFFELLYSPWRYGFLLQGPEGQITATIGYTQLLILATTAFVILRKRSRQFRKDQIYWFVIVITLVFLLLPVSKALWDTVPKLQIIAIATRLLLFVAVGISMLAAIVVLQTKRKWLIYACIILTIGYTILNWGHRRVIPEITDRTLQRGLPQSTAYGEGWAIGVPIWRKKDNAYRFEKSTPKKEIEIREGKGEIKSSTRTSTRHIYIVYAENDLLIKENTWYFPGWKVLLDNKETQIQYEDKNDPGIIIFSVPKGLHRVEVVYQDLSLHTRIKQLSIGTILVISFFIVFKLLFFLTSHVKLRKRVKFLSE